MCSCRFKLGQALRLPWLIGSRLGPPVGATREHGHRNSILPGWAVVDGDLPPLGREGWQVALLMRVSSSSRLTIPVAAGEVEPLSAECTRGNVAHCS